MIVSEQNDNKDQIKIFSLEQLQKQDDIEMDDELQKDNKK